MKERELMTQEEFEKYIGVGQLRVFDTVKKYRSVRRAMRRGHITTW